MVYFVVSMIRHLFQKLSAIHFISSFTSFSYQACSGHRCSILLNHGVSLLFYVIRAVHNDLLTIQTYPTLNTNTSGSTIDHQMVYRNYPATFPIHYAVRTILGPWQNPSLDQQWSHFPNRPNIIDLLLLK